METVINWLETPLDGPAAGVGIYLVLVAGLALCVRWCGRGGDGEPGEW